MTRPSQREFFKPERLLAFSDGVFAIAVTHRHRHWLARP